MEGKGKVNEPKHPGVPDKSAQKKGGIPPCRYFQSPAGCHHGDACKFLHSDVTAGVQRTWVPNVECRYYNSPTGCMGGENCTFLHDGQIQTIGPAPQVPCKYFNTAAGCRKGHQCTYKHVRGGLSVCKFFSKNNLQCAYGDDCIFLHQLDESHQNNTLRKTPLMLVGKDSNSNWEALVASGVATAEVSKDDLHDDASKDTLVVLQEVVQDEASGRIEANVNETAYACSHCREQFKGDRKLNKLQEHYYIQISKAEQKHMKLLQKNAIFNEKTFCLLCGLHLSDAYELLVHCGKAAQKNNDHGLEHQDFLKEMAEKFMGLDAGLYTEHDILQYIKLQLVASFTESSTNETDEITRALAQFGLSAHDSSSGSEGMCGFSQDEVNELLCQGIKPWDPEASAALDILYDY